MPAAAENHVASRSMRRLQAAADDTEMNTRAATFRDSDHRVVRTTWAGSMCLAPRRPSLLAAVSDDGRRAHGLPCGRCSGCMVFQRMRLARRLVNHYGKSEDQLWSVEVKCAADFQQRLFRLVRRTAMSCELRGWVRLGRTGVALIVAASVNPGLAIRLATGCSSRCGRIVRPSRKRAWRAVTRGLLVDRHEYGEQVNRWYHRGLAPAERDAWTIAKRGGVRSRNSWARAGARATADGVALYAPEDWRPTLIPRRKGPLRRRAFGPRSGVAAIADILQETFAGAGARGLPLNEAGAARRRSGSSMPGFRIASAAHGAQRDAATGIKRPLKHAADATALPKTNPLFSKGVGYRSSVNSEDVRDPYLQEVLARIRARTFPRDP